MIVRIPFHDPAILTMTNRDNVTIPVNPRTNRPAGYAFVTVSTFIEADRAISQLSNKEMLERKVSIQRATVAEIKAPGSGTPAAEQRVFATSNELMETYKDNGEVQVKEDPEESDTPYRVSEAESPKST